MTATTTEQSLSDRALLDAWNPEDEELWAAGARRIARRNLVLSILSEHIGFSVWSLWSVLVLFLGPAYHVDAAGKFLLTSVPTLVGSVLRLPYSFAVTRFGGRNWTVFSALILLVPCALAAFLVKPGVSYSTLLVLAAITGVGGGNFASSMTNINAFYPDRLKGWALGLNAGGGNIGVAAVQLVGLAVLAWSGKGHPGLVAGIYLPLIVLAAAGAALYMDNLPNRSAEKGAIREVARRSVAPFVAVVNAEPWNSREELTRVQPADGVRALSSSTAVRQRGALQPDTLPKASRARTSKHAVVPGCRMLLNTVATVRLARRR